FENNDAAFQQYDKFKKRVGDGRCNEESNGGTDAEAYASCKNTTICGLRAARSQDNCVVPKPGLNIIRRDESEAHGAEVHTVTGECESTSVGHVLQQLSILASDKK
ncbi:hypothetical protein MPER_00181, partial [Moniliophthora perniciosa FA553]